MTAELSFALTATYLGAALTAAFICVLVAFFYAESSGTNSASRATYLLFGFAVGYLVFYLTLLVLPYLVGGG